MGGADLGRRDAWSQVRLVAARRPRRPRRRAGSTVTVDERGPAAGFSAAVQEVADAVTDRFALAVGVVRMESLGLLA